MIPLSRPVMLRRPSTLQVMSLSSLVNHCLYRFRGALDVQHLVGRRRNGIFPPVDGLLRDAPTIDERGVGGSEHCPDFGIGGLLEQLSLFDDRGLILPGFQKFANAVI